MVENNKETMESKRLQILENSLVKKEAQFQSKLDAHFADVKRANGQPMNDKRNGQATLGRWERQNESLRNLQSGIQKTKEALEKEKYKIEGVESQILPDEIKDLLSAGKLIQWRKHPNMFFVPGVEKARLVWDEKLKKVLHRYVSEIPFGTGQFDLFKEVFNKLNNTLNAK